MKAGTEADAGIATENSAADLNPDAAVIGSDTGNNFINAAISDKELIKVYVVGCVNNPGIVTLEKGQLIDDAVQKAGGLTNEASAQNINMVYELNENTMLYIKSKKELEAEQKNYSQVQKAAGQTFVNPGNGAVIIKDSGESAAVIGSGNDNQKVDNSGNVSCININTADVGELDTLPGIGEATARDIIAFREKNGFFRKIEDIMKVPRIKQSRFNSIKDFITIE